MRRFIAGLLRIVGASVPALCAGCFPTVSTDLGAGDEGASSSGARCVASEDAERLADQVLQLVNLERADAGLPPVVRHPALDKVADDYACRMITENFFGHTDPADGHGPGDRALIAKYAFYAIGENLAAGQQTPAEVMRVWMESPAHREIILDEKWNDLGISVRQGGEYGVYWVQEFGTPSEY